MLRDLVRKCAGAFGDSLTPEPGREAVHGPTVAGFGHCGAHDGLPIGPDIDKPVMVLGHDSRSPDRLIAVLDTEQLMHRTVMIGAASWRRFALSPALRAGPFRA
jgi:hypothetical protein